VGEGERAEGAAMSSAADQQAQATRSPEEIRADIDATREEVGDTVEALAGKTDVIPNKTNVTWIEPERPGVFLGQCAEFCGTQHALMLLRVVVHPRDEWERTLVEIEREIERSDVSAVSSRRQRPRA